VYFGLTAVLWWTIGKADIPVTFYESTFKDTTDINYDFCQTSLDCVFRSQKVEIDVSFLIFMITTASLIGWVLFSVFGGVGIPALPFDLLMDYKYRPKRIKLQEYTDKKKLIGEQAGLLLQASAALMEEKKKVGRSRNFQNWKQRTYKTKENEFKRVISFSKL
jgi:LMBR1 domain-containing protein 1